MGSNAWFARHFLIRAWLILIAGLYLLVFHVLWASRACLASLCLPPNSVVPPSPVNVAWSDLVVGVLYLLIGVRGLWLRSGARVGHTHSKERETISTEQNKQLVLRWKDAGYNKKNLDVIDELFAPNYVGHTAGFPGPVRGPAALKHLFAAYFAAFDIRDTPEFLIAEGDMVVIHDTYYFKHIGAFQGIPPTGQEVTMTGTDIYRIVDGKFVEQWVDADYTGLMHQFGVLPAPRQGTP